MRYLSLDIGERSIGLAVGEMIGRELTTLKAAKGKSFYDEPIPAFEAIKSLKESEQVDALIAGLPVNDEGELSQEASKIKQFAEGLKKYLDIEIELVNETLTSFMAEDILENLGLSIAESKLREHQLSAKLILDQFLEDNETI